MLSSMTTIVFIARTAIGLSIALVVMYYTFFQICDVQRHNLFFRMSGTSRQSNNQLHIRYKDALRDDLTSARLTSPFLDSEGIVEAVEHMYSTSKRLRPFYEDPHLKQDKFTIVMLSYNRTSNLYLIFRTYCGMNKIIDKILVIWNNIGMPIPKDLLSMPCSFPIVFLPQKHNSLNNRFIPFPEIETECIFSFDDDHSITVETLTFGFNVWKTFPHLLVGYFPRVHGKSNGKYYYKGTVKHGEPYSMIITGAAFINVKYLGIYTNSSNKVIHKFVDQYKNGEDIAMVAIVTNYLKKIDGSQCAGLWVRESTPEMETTKKKSSGLSQQRHHHEKRNKCINMLTNLYGTMPMHMCSLEATRLNNKIMLPNL